MWPSKITSEEIPQAKYDGPTPLLATRVEVGEDRR